MLRLALVRLQGEQQKQKYTGQENLWHQSSGFSLSTKLCIYPLKYMESLTLYSIQDETRFMI